MSKMLNAENILTEHIDPNDTTPNADRYLADKREIVKYVKKKSWRGNQVSLASFLLMVC